jgi:hypothetical protein
LCKPSIGDETRYLRSFYPTQLILRLNHTSRPRRFLLSMEIEEFIIQNFYGPQFLSDSLNITVPQVPLDLARSPVLLRSLSSNVRVSCKWSIFFGVEFEHSPHMLPVDQMFHFLFVADTCAELAQYVSHAEKERKHRKCVTRLSTYKYFESDCACTSLT